MVSTWFRNDSKLTIKDLVKVLHPKASLQDRSLEERSRFSQLLLEFGEVHMQDWAVMAYSSPMEDDSGRNESDLPRKDDKIQWEQSPLRPSARRSAKSRHRTSTVQPMDKDYYPSVRMAKIEGRLHLCSRSLVFEPYDISRGIIRCPFARMEGSPKEYPPDPGFEAMCVELHSKRHVVMKANNVIGPFEPVLLPVRFRFTFLHSSPKSFVDLCDHLFQMASQSKSTLAHFNTELDSLLKPMLDRPFDPDNLVDIREQVLISNVRCAILTPLQSRPGTLVVTSERIYFQPAAGVLSATDTRAIRWLLRDAVAIARRYKGLRDSALEVYWKDETSTLFAFERRHDREQVLNLLPANLTCFTDREFVVSVYKEWQRCNISNFEYLLALNSAAGRSFHDLSRYPVFPWVIADYESTILDLNKRETFRDLTKPMGALNEDRLKYFHSRYIGMQGMEEPFLYGTHYSTPGYVLYFLVRSMPEHMLCLQNGKFDAPDRMFHSVLHCYKCALTNHADVKELIPEFYNASNDFDFLINARGLQLGATQNGDRVDDVKLPPWARSARDFIKKNRKALESDICTKMLPKWIDLIFGSASRGEAAKEHANLFHPITYLGPRDLANMQSEDDRFQAELQASEFGIVPDQLFQSPHPIRENLVSDDFVSPDLGRASSKDDASGSREAWELLEPPSSTTQSDLKADEGLPSHESNLSEPEQGQSYKSIDNNNDESEPWTKSLRAALTSHSSEADNQARKLALKGRGESSISSGDVAVSDTDQMKDPSMSAHEPQLSPKVQQLFELPLSSEWDIKIIERASVHSDTVSGCVLVLNGDGGKDPILATSSLDGGLKVHSLRLHDSAVEDRDKRGIVSPFGRFSYSTIMSRSQISQPAAQSKLTEMRSHSTRDPLASLVLASDGAGGSVAFAGGHDDVVLAYGINSACAVASVYSHRDAVTGLDLIARSVTDAESALWIEKATHIMISGSWDATVKVWSATVLSGETVSISREPLAELFDADSSIVCVSAINIQNGGIVIGAGCADGSFCVWNVHNDGVKVVMHKEQARRGSGPCSVVKWIAEGKRLHFFTAFSTGKVSSYSLVDGGLKREAAVAIGVPILSLVYTEGVLLVGCSDGGLRLIPVRDGVFFESKPTLWNAVNNKSSPGISSISVCYTTHTKETPSRCICCTGGEDGSIALFELKRTT